MSLKGVRVLEFAGLAPVPMAGKILKDMGAQVIRIDKAGTTISMDRLAYGKKSIAINLKQTEGIEIVKKLAKQSDVLIEPFRKGVMERLGLGPNIIHKLNPNIIYTRLTGYGQYGELAEKAGHDINYLSYSGVLSSLGRKNEKPHAPINIIADFAGGGLMCALSVLSCLYEQKNTKKINKVIDHSMVEGAAYVSQWLWTSRDLPGLWGNPKGENYLDGGLPRYDTYKTKDGEYMASGGLEPQFYNDMLIGLELTEHENVTEEVLEEAFLKKTREEWVEVFKGLDACVSPVLSLDEAAENKHNKERGSFIKSADKSTWLPTMDWLDKSANTESFLPEIGEHTSGILSKLGYSDDDIEKLIQNDVVEQGKAKHISKL